MIPSPPPDADLQPGAGAPAAVGALGPDGWRGLLANRWFLVAALLVLNLLDVGLTKAVLAAGGAEVNPLMEPIIEHPVAPVLVKVLAVAGVACLLALCPPQSRLVQRALRLAVSVYAVVVLWNVVVLVVSVAIT